MVEANATSNEAAGPDITTMSFRAPEKTIITPEHVEIFKKSNGCEELLGFITALMTACKTSKMTQTEMTEVSISVRGFI